MDHDYSLGKKLHPKENLTKKLLDLLSKKTPKSHWLLGVSPLALAACGGSSSESSLTLRTGTAGADMFPNSRANERFEGGLGADIYQLNYGGQDEIVDFGGIDEIIIPFNEVNNHTRKSLERIGDNLVITQIDGSSITIYNQFSGNTSIEYLNYYLGGNSIGRERFGSLDIESVSETELNLLIGSNANETFSYNGFAVLSIWANDGNDTITTGAAGDCIRTGDGNDIINAGGGDDQVFAGDGNDTIEGGDGDDTIQGDDGSDTLRGGDGADTFVFNVNETGTDIIADFSLLAGDKLDLTSYGIYTELAARALMSNVSTGVNITISGSVILTINGITINDFTLADGWLVNVRDTSATSIGGRVINAGGGDDQVVGGDGNDIIRGGDGDDTIEGGDGDDFIEGGNGDDFIEGGNDADTFVFNVNETGTDIIADFSLLAGDKLDLTSYGIYTELAARALMSNVSTGVNITISDIVILTINGISINEFTLADGWLVSVRDTSATSIGVDAVTPTVPFTTRPTTEFSFSTDRGSYVLVADAKTYTEAASYARSELNGTLASFESKSDFDGFYSALQATVTANSLTPTRVEEYGNAEFIWLGATELITEDRWIWDSGVDLTYDDFWGTAELWADHDPDSEPDNYFYEDGLAIGMEDWPAVSESGAGYGDAGFWEAVDVSNTLYFVVELG